MGTQVPRRGRGGAVAEDAAPDGPHEGSRAPGCGDRHEASAAASRQPAHSRPAQALLRAGRFGDDRAPCAQGRGPRAGARGAEAQARREALAGALRAGGAQPAVAVGSLHVPAASPGARVRGGLHGRPLALHRELRHGAPPEELARDGGTLARHCRLRRAARDPHRPGQAVHGLARLDRLRGGAQAQRHRAREEPAAPSADLRQDRAVLEDDVGRVPVAHGVRRLRRLPAACGDLRAALQLPAAASGAGGAHACRSLLPLRSAGARGDRGDRRGQRAAPCARAAAAQALLPRGTAGRSGPRDQRDRRRRAGARGQRADHDSAGKGG
jgi:hypothetical protein